MQRIICSYQVRLLVVIVASVALDTRGAEPPKDGAEFLALLESRFMHVRDLQFSFSSRTTSLDARVPVHATSCNGAYSYSREFGERLEALKATEGRAPMRLSISVTAAHTRTLLHAPTGTRQGFVDVGHGQLDSPGLPYRVLYLPKAQHYREEIRQSFRFDGVEEVESHTCFKVSVDLAKGGVLTETLWIDPERGANPLRIERHRAGKLSFRASAITLQRFDTTSGPVWLPMSGSCTSHVYLDPNDKTKKSFKSAAEPLVLEEITIDPASVRINQGIDEKSIRLEFEKGLVVRDSVKGERYRFGQPAGKLSQATAEEAEAVIDRNIAEAERQAAMPIEVAAGNAYSGQMLRWVAITAGVILLLLALAWRHRST